MINEQRHIPGRKKKLWIDGNVMVKMFDFADTMDADKKENHI